MYISIDLIVERLSLRIRMENKISSYRLYVPGCVGPLLFGLGVLVIVGVVVGLVCGLSGMLTTSTNY